jgi:hypothetical protein
VGRLGNCTSVLAPAKLKRPLPPENILALSGGGDDGAFGAGLLVGWSEKGTRPKFKVVTCISTGELIAPFAFLGSKYTTIVILILIRAQGNESRLTPQRPQYIEQIFWVPSGALTAALDGSLVGDLAHQIEGEVADHGHVFGSMTGAQA